MSENGPVQLYLNIPDFRDKYSQGVLTPKIGINFAPKSNMLLYVSASRGYASGGWSNGILSSLKEVKFKPEYAMSYEFGGKANLPNYRLQLNTCIFYENFSDFQTVVGELIRLKAEAFFMQMQQKLVPGVLK